MNSAGSGLKGAVACTAFIAALSAPGSPEDLNTLQDNNLPSFAILNNSTTRLLSFPFGGSQFILIRLCNSLMYGPKSGSLIASIPGLPFGFPGPGFPYPPVPPPPPLASLLPEPPVGANDGAGAYLPLPDDVLPPPPPPLADVPDPLIGPVEYLPEMYTYLLNANQTKNPLIVFFDAEHKSMKLFNEDKTFWLRITPHEYSNPKNIHIHINEFRPIKIRVNSGLSNEIINFNISIPLMIQVPRGQDPAAYLYKWMIEEPIKKFKQNPNVQIVNKSVF